MPAEEKRSLSSRLHPLLPGIFHTFEPFSSYKWNDWYYLLLTEPVPAFLFSSTDPFLSVAVVERESQADQEQMRQKWESLRLELKTKLQLLQKNLEKDHKLVQTLLYCHCSKWNQSLLTQLFQIHPSLFPQQVYSRPSRVTTSASLFREESQVDKSSLKTLFDNFRQTIEDMPSQVFNSSLLNMLDTYWGTLLYQTEHI